MNISKPARAVLAGLLLAAAGGGTLLAATSTVECGLFRDYVIPDPVALTTGSISFGLSGPVEIIAADAILAPPADTNLPSLAGGPPTCLTVGRDAGVITSLAFASSGSISGPVELVPDLFGPGSDGYTIADRLFAPVQIVEDNAGLNAIIATAAASGSPLALTFTIDLTSGAPSAIDATVTLSGDVDMQPNGDVRIGDATLLDEVIGTAARLDLAEAAGLNVPASVLVVGHGSIDAGSPGGVAMAITLSVSFAAPAATTTEPTLPNAAVTELPPGSSDWQRAQLFALAGLVMLAGLLRFARPR